MSRTEPLQIRVLGLGNLMRTDDAIGMLAARRLADDDRLPPGIEVIEGGTLGLDLLHAIHGISHLLVMDAVDSGVAPGTVTQFSGDELAGLPTSKSVHLLGFADLMDVLRLMEASPTEVILLGVQPDSTDWGTELTPAVAAAQPDLVEAALRQIAQWAEEIRALSALASLSLVGL
jgi:hydrogenase maturation protease